MGDSIRVLIVDDHPVVCEGVRAMLSGEPGIEVVGEASSGDEALLKADELDPHVILMDIQMPGMSAFEATQRLKQARPATSVIMLTMYGNQTYVVEAIRSGAAGYLTKDSSRDLVCHAVRSVVDGGTLVRSGLLREAIQGLLRLPKESEEGLDRRSVEHLTPRELEVLRRLARGLANRAIGSELSLAEVTVKKHVQSIIGKLGVSDRTQAAVLAVRLGLVE